eukprot:Platyproteum_vivax@DN12013_c0_g1_i1.p1
MMDQFGRCDPPPDDYPMYSLNSKNAFPLSMIMLCNSEIQKLEMIQAELVGRREKILESRSKENNGEMDIAHTHPSFNYMEHDPDIADNRHVRGQMPGEYEGHWFWNILHDPIIGRWVPFAVVMLLLSNAPLEVTVAFLSINFLLYRLLEYLLRESPLEFLARLFVQNRRRETLDQQIQRLRDLAAQGPPPPPQLEPVELQTGELPPPQPQPTEQQPMLQPTEPEPPQEFTQEPTQEAAESNEPATSSQISPLYKRFYQSVVAFVWSFYPGWVPDPQMFAEE